MQNLIMIIDLPLHLFGGHSIFCSKKNTILHIKETKIETLVVDPESLSEKEKQRIQVHIKDCSYCKDIYNTHLKMYKKIENDLDKNPSSKDKMIAKRIFENLLQNSLNKSQKKK